MPPFSESQRVQRAARVTRFSGSARVFASGKGSFASPQIEIYKTNPPRFPRVAVLRHASRSPPNQRADFGPEEIDEPGGDNQEDEHGQQLAAAADVLAAVAGALSRGGLVALFVLGDVLDVVDAHAGLHGLALGGGAIVGLELQRHPRAR